MRVLLFSLFAVLFVVARPALAAPESYSFDKLHTQITFFVNHLGFSNSSGKFLDFDGGFKFDETKPEDSSVEVTIKTDSINMDDATWDDHLKAADYFNVAEFPEMTFKSTKVEKTGDKTGKITGDLTLLGVTKPVVLDVVFNKAGPHPMNGKHVAGFSATTHLKRSEWGMKGGLPVVGDDVELRIEVEGARDDGVQPDQSNH